MNRRFIQFMLLLAPALLWGRQHAAGAGAAAGPEGNRPNVVFILADDLGYGDVRSFGGDRCRIDTPHFDRLAAEGMRFTDAHAIASVCIPSRIGIMTGRYAWRFRGAQGSGPWGFVAPYLPTGQWTLGTMLRASGYRTGYVGKWHLGTRMQTVDGKTQGYDNVDYTKPLSVGPPQYGFDDSFILPGSLDMYPYAFVRNNRWVGSVTAMKGWSAFHRVGPAAEDFEDVKVLDTFCREAEQFIAESASKANDRKPFFLYLAWTSPHTPLCPSAGFEGKSRIGLYGDFVMETDHCVGRLLAALKAHGLDDRTLVIATSDHGAAPYAGRKRKATAGQLIDLEKEGHYASGIYRGYKFSVYEGAFRVPFVARWPGVVPPGSRCDRLVALSDLIATLAEIVGYRLAEDQAPDSFSILPLLKAPESAPARMTLVMQATQAFALRAGDWKLAICPGSGTAGRWGNTPPRGQAWKDALAAYGRQPQSMAELEQSPFVQLFNLAEDPGETTNLAARHPEKVKQFFQLFRKQVAAGRSTPGAELQNDVDRVAPFRGGVPAFVWKKETRGKDSSP